MTPALAALLVASAALARPEVAADEAVVLFPTAARLVDGGAAWEVPVDGWVFELEARPALVAALRLAVDPPDEEQGPEGDALLVDRARHLLADNERGKRVTVRAAGQEARLGPSGKDGRFTGTLRVPAGDVPAVPGDTRSPDARLAVEVVLPEGDGRRFAGEAVLVPPRGVSVVSDLDDTLKVTEVRDRRAMLLNTFYRPFRAAPGMAARFRAWAAQPGVRFHYLSGSPRQLWPALAPFLEAEGFPPGSAHLKPVRLVDRTVKRLWEGSEPHKRGVLRELLAAFPERTFVLVGDSGEEDPEIYGAIAREHPGRVARIHIRDVTGEPGDAPRYEAAFAGLPAGTGHVFTDAAALPDRPAP